MWVSKIILLFDYLKVTESDIVSIQTLPLLYPKNSFDSYKYDRYLFLKTTPCHTNQHPRNCVRNLQIYSGNRIPVAPFPKSTCYVFVAYLWSLPHLNNTLAGSMEGYHMSQWPCHFEYLGVVPTPIELKPINKNVRIPMVEILPTELIHLSFSCAKLLCQIWQQRNVSRRVNGVKSESFDGH